jgi:hypothetical protein
MSKAFKGLPITLALLVAVLGLWLFWVTRPVGWWDIARMTWVRVPEGAICSAVTHETEVEYHGTIELKSAADVAEFIRVNGLTPMREHVEENGWVSRGNLALDVPKERYADTYVLWAHSKYNAWEFILDPRTRRVRYEVLVPDYAGDLPGEAGR